MLDRKYNFKQRQLPFKTAFPSTRWTKDRRNLLRQIVAVILPSRNWTTIPILPHLCHRAPSHSRINADGRRGIGTLAVVSAVVAVAGAERSRHSPPLSPAGLASTLWPQSTNGSRRCGRNDSRSNGGEPDAGIDRSQAQSSTWWCLILSSTSASPPNHSGG